jgi:hypothetical protein
VKRARAVVAILVAVAACACTADQKEQPMRPDTTTAERPGEGRDEATDPAEPIQELVADADLIVTGSVIEVEPSINAINATNAQTFDPQTATIAVESTLKGDVEPGKLTITKPESPYFLAGASDARNDRKVRSGGIFVLRDTGDKPTLFGYVGVHDHEFAPQWFDRVLAGLPPKLPPPTNDQLSEWAARSDVIVFAAATGDAGRVEMRTPRLDWAEAGTLEPIEVLKGDLAGHIEVARGPQPTLPGGTWAFPVQKERTGVFFLDMSSEPPTVINTAAPWDVFSHQVRRILRG